MYYIYREDLLVSHDEMKKINILDKATTHEDAMLKLFTLSRRQQIKDTTFTIEKKNHVEEWKHNYNEVTEGWWPYTVTKKIDTPTQVARYGIIEMSKTISRKNKQPEVYDKDEMIEFLKCNTSQQAPSEEKAIKIYVSISKMTKEDREELFRWCEEDQKRGDILNIMGLVKELENDNEACMEYYLQSAQKGYLLGIRNLALLHEKCHRVETSISWFKKAIDAGDLKSMKLLSQVYAKLSPTKSNKENSKMWKIKYEESSSPKQ